MRNGFRDERREIHSTHSLQGKLAVFMVVVFAVGWSRIELSAAQPIAKIEDSETGELIGEITRAVYEMQLDGRVRTLEDAQAEAQKLLSADYPDYTEEK